MKNWNKIGQYIATGTSAALLASFTSLFAPTSVEAVSLIKGDDGAVTRIEGLEASGNDWNVDFEWGTYEEVFTEGLQLTYGPAFWVALEIMGVLGKDEVLSGHPSVSDSFFLPYDDQSSGLRNVQGFFDYQHNSRADRLAVTNIAETEHRLWAVVVEAEVGEMATTPEPSLIFGFITLGGLMLGSKRKTKG